MIVNHELIGKYTIDTSSGQKFETFIREGEPGNINIKILKYLSGIENGFFVEAGAHDGIFQSNTKILEDLEWDGLLIEPSLALYEKCLLHRKCKTENFALVSNDFKGDKIGEHDIILMGDEPRGYCPASTFTKIALKHNIKKIDVFFLDVEGYEIEALKGIDFDNIDITYFVIEVNSTIEEMDKFMNSKGYENVINLSNFNLKNCPSWPGTHQDYLYKKIK